MKCLTKIVAAVLTAAIALTGFAPVAYAAPTDDLAAAQAQLSSLGTELETLQTDLQEKSDALEANKQAINEKQDEIDQTQADLEDARTTLGNRMRSSYKSGSVNIIDVLLQSTDFEDLISRIYYMDKVNKSDADAIDAVQTLESQLNDQKAELEQKQTELQTELDDTQAKVDDYQAKVEEAQAYYDTLDAQVQAELAAEAEAAAANNTNDATSTAVNTVTESNSNSSSSGSNGSDSSSSGSSSGSTTTGGSGGAGLTTAYSMIGVPYVYGGASASGVDCSGLVCYCYGYNRGRTTYDMIASLQASGSWKTSLSELQVGDLVFPSSGHVGIYIGNGQMIHAPYPGRTVCIASVYSFIGGGTY